MLFFRIWKYVALKCYRNWLPKAESGWNAMRCDWITVCECACLSACLTHRVHVLNFRLPENGVLLVVVLVCFVRFRLWNFNRTKLDCKHISKIANNCFLYQTIYIPFDAMHTATTKYITVAVFYAANHQTINLSVNHMQRHGAGVDMHGVGAAEWHNNQIYRKWFDCRRDNANCTCKCIESI